MGTPLRPGAAAMALSTRRVPLPHVRARKRLPRRAPARRTRLSHRATLRSQGLPRRTKTSRLCRPPARAGARRRPTPRGPVPQGRTGQRVFPSPAAGTRLTRRFAPTGAVRACRRSRRLGRRTARLSPIGLFWRITCRVMLHLLHRASPARLRVRPRPIRRARGGRQWEPAIPIRPSRVGQSMGTAHRPWSRNASLRAVRARRFSLSR